MEAITASLERSMQNCSLNGVGGGPATATPAGIHHPSADTTVELNSDVSLPYQWEQCLDLKTGEIYYINWRNGMKAEEDPRQATSFEEDYYSEVESSTESEDDDSSVSSREEDYRSEVLVVAGCKSCLMYFMLPKRVECCPKCTGFVLHFDRPEDGLL